MRGTAARYRAAGDLCPRAGAAAAGHRADLPAEQQDKDIRLSLPQGQQRARARTLQGKERLRELP